MTYLLKPNLTCTGFNEINCLYQILAQLLNQSCHAVSGVSAGQWLLVIFRIVWTIFIKFTHYLLQILKNKNKKCTVFI